MMWNKQYHDGRRDSELGVMRHDPPDMESGHAEHQNSSALHPHSTHDLESARLAPVALEVSKPGGALLLSSTIIPLLTAPSSETSNYYYIHDRWSSSTSRDNVLSNKQTTGTSSQSSFLHTDENAMQTGMNIDVSSSLTGSISNDNEMGGRVGGRVINWQQQQQAVLSAMSSEVVRNSMMTIKSHPVETYSAEEKEVPYHSLHFPWRLHQMLEAAESHGFSHIVSWLPELQDGHHHKSARTQLRSDSTRLTDSDEMEQEQSSPLSRKKRISGTPFRVHEPGIFEKVIMPRFFRQTKFKSFRRQINLWSFERIRNGPNKGGYQSDYFVRTNPSLCARMRRSKSKRPLQDHDEDFATQSAASSSILEQQQQQQVTATGSMIKSSGLSSSKLGSQLHKPPTISVTPASATVALPEHTSMMMPRGQEGDTQTTTATTTTNTDQHFHTGNSLSSSSLSWFESHQVSLLSYAYTVMRVSQNDMSVSNLDSTVPAPSSNDSATDDIEQELISTFCPAFHMLLESEDNNNTRHPTLDE